ncbi:MAG: NUDIX hydrolase [Firmicutes bacterium]|nr:NUDIX hydrolase [Bacillota bacterium]
MDLLKTIIESFEPCCEQEKQDQKTILRHLEQGEELLTRDNELMHFTSSCWVMNPQKTKALMVHHNIYNAWSWMGGHADGCADLLAVAKKELAEESGVTDARLLSEIPITLEMIGVQSHEKKGKYIAPHIHLNVTYLFEVDENTSLRIKEDENSGVMWRDLKAIREDTTEPHMNKLYNKLLDRLNL